MAAKKGSLSISSENIFPIIKKWVYSDHDFCKRACIQWMRRDHKIKEAGHDGRIYTSG